MSRSSIIGGQFKDGQFNKGQFVDGQFQEGQFGDVHEGEGAVFLVGSFEKFMAEVEEMQAVKRRERRRSAR